MMIYGGQRVGVLIFQLKGLLDADSCWHKGEVFKIEKCF